MAVKPTRMERVFVHMIPANAQIANMDVMRMENVFAIPTAVEVAQAMGHAPDCDAVCMI